MIEISVLKERLDKFPDNYLVSALEDDESSMLAIYTKTKSVTDELSHIEYQVALKSPEPIGYISTIGGLTVAFKDENDQIGEEITDDSW